MRALPTLSFSAYGGCSIRTRFPFPSHRVISGTVPLRVRLSFRDFSRSTPKLHCSSWHSFLNLSPQPRDQRGFRSCSLGSRLYLLDSLPIRSTGVWEESWARSP